MVLATVFGNENAYVERPLGDMSVNDMVYNETSNCQW